MSTKAKDEIELAVMNERLIQVQATVQNILKRLDDQYVTNDQFQPVKTIVYGLVGIVLTSFAVGIVYLVFKPR